MGIDVIGDLGAGGKRVLPGFAAIAVELYVRHVDAAVTGRAHRFQGGLPVAAVAQVVAVDVDRMRQIQVFGGFDKAADDFART